MNKKYTLIIALIIVVIGVIPIKLFKQPASGEEIGGLYEKINIIGETAKNGIYDSSIEYDEKGTGWLAYSAVVMRAGYVDTHLAKTSDHGKTWTYVKKINPSENDSITLLDGTKAEGVWRHEVPTLVYDPDDPGKQWKLFWHKYFCKHPYGPKNRMFQYGWIAYKYASSPEELVNAKEIPLFRGTWPLAPYQAQCNLNNLHSDLKNILSYSEPGSLVTDGVLYLTLQAFEFPGTHSNSKTILIYSHNHGNTWEYAGTLTDYQDAVDLGHTLLTASSLAEEDGRVFLLMSPSTNTPLRHGIYVLEFEDLSQAKLKRDFTGKLIVRKFLQPSLKGLGNSGVASYDTQNTYGGIIIGQVGILNYPDVIFEIFNTKQRIVEKGARTP